MPNATIPSLASVGLATVPGYRIDPATGAEDPRWRHDPDPAIGWFAWHDAVNTHRTKVLERCAEDASFRDSIATLCRNDPAYFCLLWLPVEEPRAVAKLHQADIPQDWDAEALFELAHGMEYHAYQTIHPFIPFAPQVRLLYMVANQILNPAFMYQEHDTFIDKARGWGCSYVMLAAAYWLWLFKAGVKGAILTEKWDKADRAHSVGTLFGKLDLFFAATPPFLRPKDFRDQGEKQADRLKGILHNPANGSAIFSEPPTMSATRGDRLAYLMGDEVAFWEYFTEAWAATQGTTFKRFAWSSPSWQKGMQWQDRLDAAREAGPREATVITLDWYENPYHDRGWYERTRARFAASGQVEQFEVEYLRNPAGGYGTLVYKEQVDRCPDVDAWYDPALPLFISCDPGGSDITAWVFYQVHFRDGKKRVRWIDSYERAKLPVHFHAHVLTGIEPQPGDEAYKYWAEGFFGEREHYIMEWMRTVPPRDITLYGDPAMLSGQILHGSFEATFAKETKRLRARAGLDPIGIGFRLPAAKPLYRRNNYEDRRVGLREALMFSEFSMSEGAQSLKFAMGMTRFQEPTEKTTRPPGHIHDRYYHKVSAAEFAMVLETLKLSRKELAPPKIEKPKSLARRKPGFSVYQSKTRSLVGVT
jgi:hypothetical protein